jgi:hypothetical protein
MAASGIDRAREAGSTLSAMTFEVPVERIGGGKRRWTVGAVVVGWIAVVAVAFVTGGSAGRIPTDGRPAADARATAAAPAPVGQGSVATRVARPPAPAPRTLPASLTCRDVDHATCLRVAKAAMLVLPPELPAVRDATVWGSLFCNDDFDCPQRYIDQSVPLGSVVVRFVDRSPRAAINVVDWRYSASIRLGARAWLARWMPEPG